MHASTILFYFIFLINVTKKELSFQKNEAIEIKIIIIFN